MHLGKTFSARLAIALIILTAAGGCSAPQRPPLFVSPDFPVAGIRTIHLPPVTFEPRYEPPSAIDLDQELRQRLKTVLASKGYGVDLTPDGGRDSDASLQVHVDFLFISETFSERQPPPAIDIEAEGRLIWSREGMELWRDRGGGRVGGTGGSRIVYPTADRFLALSLLADHLLATLPPVAGR